MMVYVSSVALINWRSYVNAPLESVGLEFTLQMTVPFEAVMFIETIAPGMGAPLTSRRRPEMYTVSFWA